MRYQSAPKFPVAVWVAVISLITALVTKFAGPESKVPSVQVNINQTQGSTTMAPNDKEPHPPAGK
jgi:hypothetical protein